MFGVVVFASFIADIVCSSHLASLGLLSCEGFLWFLLSEDNNVISQEKLDKGGVALTKKTVII